MPMKSSRLARLPSASDVNVAPTRYPPEGSDACRFAESRYRRQNCYRPAAASTAPSCPRRCARERGTMTPDTLISSTLTVDHSGPVHLGAVSERQARPLPPFLLFRQCLRRHRAGRHHIVHGAAFRRPTPTRSNTSRPPTRCRLPECTEPRPSRLADCPETTAGRSTGCRAAAESCDSTKAPPGLRLRTLMAVPCLQCSRQRTDQLEPALYSSISANALFHNAPPAALRRCANAVGAHRSAKKSPAWEISVFPPDPAKMSTRSWCRATKFANIRRQKSSFQTELYCGWSLPSLTILGSFWVTGRHKRFSYATQLKCQTST